MKINQLIEKFNNEKNIIVFTTYPPKKTVYNGQGGISSFGKNFVKSLTKNKKINIVVFAPGNKKEIYQENKQTLVFKIFKRNKFFFFYPVLFYLLKFNRIKKIIFHFEFSSYGDLPTTIGILILLLIFKILKKETFLVVHQVETNLGNLYGHLGWKKNSFKIMFFNIFIRLYYQLIYFLSKKTIVLEKIFKKRLTNLKISNNKILVIPHPVDNNLKPKIQKNDKNSSLLYFGYLAWYKGVDWLIENINKKTNLTIAGGPSPTLKNKRHYKIFLKKIIEKVKQKNNINLTGFVKEKDLAKYFNSSKLCVLPYREMMSSSGPLSFCFSFEKPFILSRPLEGYFESEDFTEALKETGLKKEDFIFDFNKKSFEKRLAWAKNNLEKLSQFSKIMKKKRSWDKVARLYLKVLNE